MKKILCTLTLFSIMMSFCSCAISQSDTVSFYYPRADFVYDEPDGVIASEERDAAGHTCISAVWPAASRSSDAMTPSGSS